MPTTDSGSERGEGSAAAAAVPATKQETAAEASRSAIITTLQPDDVL